MDQTILIFHIQWGYAKNIKGAIQWFMNGINGLHLNTEKNPQS